MNGTRRSRTWRSMSMACEGKFARIATSGGLGFSERRGGRRRLSCKPGVVELKIVVDLADRRGLTRMEGQDPRNPGHQIDDVGVGEVIDRWSGHRNDAAHG